MAAPNVSSVSPTANETDVVLGRKVRITFDQAIDPDTISDATFSLMGPGQVGVINAEGLFKDNPEAITSREWVAGKFEFPSPNIVDFIPSKPFRPNVQYTVFLAGGDSVLATSVIKNLGGENLTSSFQFTFTTGILDLDTTPPSAPLQFPAVQQSWNRPRLKASDIQIIPHRPVGNDLEQTIELVFPGALDPNSFDPNSLEVLIGPALNDPLISIPPGLSRTVAVSGNRLLITITGLPSGA